MQKKTSALLVVAVLALAIGLGAFVLIRPDRGVTFVDNVVGSGFSWAQGSFTNATNWMINFVNNQRNYSELKVEYAALKRENDAMQLELASLEEAANENVRLRGLVGASTKYAAMDPIYGKVIARDPGVWFDTFSINIGTTSGVKENMSVVTGDGLVGRVYEVGYNYAKVLSIIDSRSAVACLVQRTRDNSVLRGVTTDASTTPSCYGYYLPNTADVAVGDTVITSGVDMLYPKGLTIGTVTGISREGESSKDYIVVTPDADFTHIEEVLVLRVEIERDSDLQSVPTATPRPTKMPSDIHLPTPIPEETPIPDNDDTIWSYPTAAPTTPPDPGDMQGQEAEWAQG